MALAYDDFDLLRPCKRTRIAGTNPGPASWMTDACC
jgi:hypothetical protein